MLTGKLGNLGEGMRGTKICWMCGCLFVALAATLVARAGDSRKKGKGDPEVFYKWLDTNKDGRLTRAEFVKMAERAREKEQARQKLGQAYDKLDPEKKGVTKEQFKRFIESAREAQPPGRKDNPGP
jgi:hypothetical protein